MKYIVGLLLTIFCWVSTAQSYFSIQYYQDTIQFGGIRVNEYDASDVLNTSDEFVRMKAEFPISEKFRLTAWLDLNSGLEPQSSRIGAQRLHGKYFALEAYAKFLSYWIPYQESMPIISGYEYDYYYGIYALGLEPIITYQWKIVNLRASIDYSRAFTGEKQLDHLYDEPGNYRSLDRYQFHLRNYQSVYGKAQLVLHVIPAKKFTVGLLYQVIFRNDYFHLEMITRWSPTP